MISARRLSLPVLVLSMLSSHVLASPRSNHFAVADDHCDIYYPDRDYPKLTTPQWVGEEGVDAVVVFAIDDMRDPARYETYLRPIINRLKKIDGSAHVSIMGNWINPAEPQLQSWLKEGVSLETHTVDHPCPILDKGDFTAAKSTYDRCVDHFFTIPNNRPVAFRTPCMDGINSAGPRLFAEIFMRTTTNNNFLTLSSSVGVLLTPEDPEIPRELVAGPNGRSRYEKYLLPGYVNYLRDYPYPYLVGNMFWEAPFMIPDDYEGAHTNGDTNATTIADMKASIDAVVAKKGLWVMTFHPYQWIQNRQVVELIDHCVSKHGKKIKFLNLKEVQERIDKHLLAGNSVRRSGGAENGIRLLDLNGDSFLDVVIGNDRTRQTRLWDPIARRWKETTFPVAINASVRFGILDNMPVFFAADDSSSGMWRWNGANWDPVNHGADGLELGGNRIVASHLGQDHGVRLRDVNGDGTTELIVSNPRQNAVFRWNAASSAWKKLNFTIPTGVSIVTEDGRDNGVRFIDFNGDGADDLIWSNESGYGLWLCVPKVFLGFKEGWSREILHGKRGDLPEIPMISRGGEFRNNGAFFKDKHLWIQNEDTAKSPDLLDRVSFENLLNGLQPPPKSPRESLQSIVISPEFTVELVVHEPLVMDPVYIDWSPDGTMWVVEMGDYPMGIDGKSGGVIRRLNDKDGDGFYETSAIFADHLNFPNGLMPWRDGVLVSAAPEILFLRDTDGDGRADSKEILFGGFVEGNQQHRCNGFELGLDNWVYGANGDSGGEIVSRKTGARTNIRGHDFRFNPDTGEFQAIEGQTQYGRKRDDWGNWFGGANYTWGWHYFLPENYLSRNPSLPVERSSRPYNRQSEGSRVFPLSRVQQRFNDIGMAGHVTSACSFAPYRDELFSKDFTNSLFICEPTHNLIHREVLEPDGISFSSKRAAAEEQREFLASRDPWFRPVNIKTGPDGALYIADMYRLVIEHPEWIPEDVKSRIDVRAGSDRGRIYRVRPTNRPLTKFVSLDKLAPPEIARRIDSPNGWQRDTVQRLLLERRKSAGSAAQPLTEIARSASNPKVRVQALCTLQAIDVITPELLAQTLKDEHPAVREHAIRLSEPYLRANSPPSQLEENLLSLARDPSPRVRYQLALSLGNWDSPKSASALAELAVREASNPDIVTAILSSSSPHPDLILLNLLETAPNIENLQRTVQHLVQLLASSKNQGAAEKVLEKLAAQKDPDNGPAAWKLSVIATILEAREKQGVTIPANQYPSVFQHARDLLEATGSSEAQRLASIRLLGREKQKLEADAERLVSLLAAQNSQAIQRAALFRLGQFDDSSTGKAILAHWKSAGPQATSLLALLLRREKWTEQLLDSLASGSTTVVDLGATLRQELLAHRSEKIRSRAEKLLQNTPSDREQLVVSMIEKVTPLAGDAERGRLAFETHCAACHRAGSAGHGNGPNLAMLYDRNVPQILTAILDPNRAVEDKYRAYNADLRNGEQISGILVNESGNSVTLMNVSGLEQTILRADIDSLRTSSRSMMPEGLDQFLKPQDFADLIAFIHTSTSPAKRFTGNHPEVITPDARGCLRLTAAAAEIYGDTLVFEGRYGNLGYWSSQNDRALWTVNIAGPTTFEVWLDFACPKQTSGNKFAIQTANSQFVGTVPATSSWDNYAQRKVGTINLPAGQSRIIFKSESALRNNLIDLREIRLVPPALGDTAFASPK